MKFLSYRMGDAHGVAIETGAGLRGLLAGDLQFPGSLDDLLPSGAGGLRAAAETLQRRGVEVELSAVEILPPVIPGKIICVGLNYADHAAESGQTLPETPTLFSRWPSSIVAAEAPIVLPRASALLDFEGELAVVIGKGGRHIPMENALDHVAGYSCFNDGSVRDYQLRTSQWMIGKNFDCSGSFGPVLATPEDLPPGARGLGIKTRLNGEVVQSSSTAELIFDVARLVSSLSEAFALTAGDVIATGTPSGVGFTRNPPLWMAVGDLCEVEIEGVGILRNRIAAEE